MQLYTPDQYAIDMDDFTSNKILLKALHVQLTYYRQQGLPATILSDIKDNGRAIAIAYFMLELKDKRPNRRTMPTGTEHDLVPASEFITFALDTFNGIANMIKIVFACNGEGQYKKVTQEYYDYFSEVAVPILMCGDYDVEEEWNPNYFSVN